MIHAAGIGLAIATTASLALANNPEDPKKNGEQPVNVLEKPEIKFTPGKGVTIDGGEAFKLNLKHQFQVAWRFVNAENAADTNGFRARRIRQAWSGHVWNEDIQYKLNWEFAEAVSVKDAFMTYKFWKSGDNNVKFWIGQGKYKQGMQGYNSSSKLELVERSMATRTFSDRRSTGVQLHGRHMAEGKFGWHADILQTDPAARSNNSAEESRNNGSNKLNYNFGINFDPWGASKWSEGDLDQTGNADGTFGADYYIGNNGSSTGTATAVDWDVSQYHLYGAWKNGGGLSLQGEFWGRSEKPAAGGTDSESMGWYAQGSWTTSPDNGTQYGFAARFGMVTNDDNNATTMRGPAGIEGGPSRLSAAGGNATKGDVTELNLGLSQYYHKHALKTQLMYSYLDTAVDGASALDTTDHGIHLMFTAIF